MVDGVFLTYHLITEETLSDWIRSHSTVTRVKSVHILHILKRMPIIYIGLHGNKFIPNWILCDLCFLRPLQVFILEELLSPIVTPFILIFHLRNKSLEIIDFFRNFTVEVVGVGDVCSFAQMDIRRHGNPTVRSTQRIQAGS